MPDRRYQTPTTTSQNVTIASPIGCIVEQTLPIIAWSCANQRRNQPGIELFEKVHVPMTVLLRLTRHPPAVGQQNPIAIAARATRRDKPVAVLKHVNREQHCRSNRPSLWSLPRKTIECPILFGIAERYRIRIGACFAGIIVTRRQLCLYSGQGAPEPGDGVHRWRARHDPGRGVTAAASGGRLADHQIA